MPRLRSSGSYTADYEPKDTNDDYAARQHRPFFVFLLVVTVTAIVFTAAAMAVLVYFRVRHGPMALVDAGDGSGLSGCPGNQVWNDCGYSCKLTCDKQYTVCAAMCSPGCECPTELPIWHRGTCIQRPDCPLPGEGNRTTTTRTEVIHTRLNTDIHLGNNNNNNQDSPTNRNQNNVPTRSLLDDPPDSDSLLHQGSRSVEFSDFINRIWSMDEHKFSGDELACDLQGKNNISSARDAARGKLFSEVGTYLSEKGRTYTTLIDLLSCFNKVLKQPDLISARKAHAIAQFLDAVMEQDVMKVTQDFLEKQGLVNTVSFREVLYDLWFAPYPRSPRYNITDSSGFEHVFVGEVKGRKISGLHNWVQFYLLEQHKGLNYYGYIHDIYIPQSKQLIAVNVKYTWESHRRKQGSFLIGTSPEFELAMYTSCFLLHPNRLCEFDIEGAVIHVSTYDVKHVPGWQILAAYPIV